MRAVRQLGLALVLATAAACTPGRPVPPNPIPTPPVQVQLNWSVGSGDEAHTTADVLLDTGVDVPGVQTSPGRYSIVLTGASGGSTQRAAAPGYQSFSQRLHIVTADLLRLQPSLVVDPTSGCTESAIPSVPGAYELCPAITLASDLPPPPTRAQLLAMQVAMYGLRCDSPTLGGNIPWWDPGIQAIADPAERQAIYGCKHRRGDTGIIIGPGLQATILYDEPDNPYQVPIPVFDIAARVLEHARAGFLTDLYLDGDGDSFQKAFDEFPIVYNKLLHGGPNGEDLNRYVTYRPGWDGVFYSCSGCWTPESIMQWAAMARGICPNCVLLLEFNTGHIPFGEGGDDYLPGGRMRDFDGVMVEFDFDLHNDNTWQILARLLGPQYIKPPDDPNGPAPWYLATPGPRGPWGVQCFEPPTYLWVRNKTSQPQADNDRAYLQGDGCPVVD